MTNRNEIDLLIDEAELAVNDATVNICRAHALHRARRRDEANACLALVAERRDKAMLDAALALYTDLAANYGPTATGYDSDTLDRCKRMTALTVARNQLAIAASFVAERWSNKS